MHRQHIPTVLKDQILNEGNYTLCNTKAVSLKTRDPTGTNLLCKADLLLTLNYMYLTNDTS